MHLTCVATQARPGPYTQPDQPSIFLTVFPSNVTSRKQSSAIVCRKLQASLKEATGCRIVDIVRHSVCSHLALMQPTHTRALGCYRADKHVKVKNGEMVRMQEEMQTKSAKMHQQKVSLDRKAASMVRPTAAIFCVCVGCNISCARQAHSELLKL